MDPDARQFLLPEHADVATNNELNELEALNIADAFAWADDQTWQTADFFTQHVLREIHAKMFDQVWVWAGTYRSREVNIGNCPPEEISTRLEQVLGNLSYQSENGRSAHDVCTALHHCIAQIHPFPNGNGRHARLVARLLAQTMGLERSSLTWGSTEYADEDTRKAAYISSLRAADDGDFGPLKSFIFGN